MAKHLWLNGRVQNETKETLRFARIQAVLNGLYKGNDAKVFAIWVVEAIRQKGINGSFYNFYYRNRLCIEPRTFQNSLKQTINAMAKNKHICLTYTDEKKAEYIAAFDRLTV